jgi:hypothetical protein
VENRDNDHAENRAILQRHISAIILPEAVDPSYEIYFTRAAKGLATKKRKEEKQQALNIRFI